MITPVAQSPSPTGRVLPNPVPTGWHARRGATIEAQAEGNPKPGNSTPPPGKDARICSVPPTPIPDGGTERGRRVSPWPGPRPAVRPRAGNPALPREMVASPAVPQPWHSVAPSAIGTEEAKPLPTIDEIRQHRGEPVDGSNARYDVNGDGRIDVADIIYLRDLLDTIGEGTLDTQA